MIETKIIHSNYLNRDVQVRIKRDDSQIYLYFFDGQNLFDKESATYNMSWHVDEVLKSIGLKANIVGIHSLENENRVFEYSPYPIENEVALSQFGPQKEYMGKESAKFIVEELMPEVEHGIVSQRLIGGSSMGGIMALYVGAQYPKLFSKVLAMSTAGLIMPMAMKKVAGLYDMKNSQRVYLDTGTNEMPGDEYVTKGYIKYNRELDKYLEGRVMKSYIEEEGAIHNEDSWNRRLPGALRWLFNL